MARLSGHPNVVDLKAVYEDQDSVHLVMELCAGGELFHRLQERGCFPEHEAATLFRYLMEVVAHCHSKGIVHRDLKPENILLVSKSPSSPIKLADFGLATYTQPGQRLSGTVGSPFYIAPEVLAGGYNEAADVWSAGVILYILLSGIPPFWGKTKSKIFECIRSTELRFPSDPWDRVSDSAKELITGMLRRDPAQRLTAEQVLEHSWIREHANDSRDSCGGCLEIGLGREEPGSCSFSTPMATRSRDVSFSTGGPIACQGLSEEPCSPTFSCRSSFSAFSAARAPAPSCGALLFSFGDSPEPMKDAAPVVSMPSFSFFCGLGSDEPEPLVASGDITTEKGAHCVEDAAVVCLNTSSSALRRMAEAALRGAAVTRANPSSRSRRNHTIGAGDERGHQHDLDMAVAESVIRYLDVLPSTFGSSVWFSDEELAEVEGTTLHRATVMQRESLQKLFDDKVKGLVEELLHVDESGSSIEVRFEDFLWKLTLQRRIVVVKRFLNLVIQSQFGLRGSCQESISVTIFYNVTDLTSLYSFLSEVQAGKSSVETGTEIYINYGNKGNEELLYLYGFVVDNNPDDYLMVHYPVEALRQLQSADVKMKLIEMQKAELRCLLPTSLLDRGFFGTSTSSSEDDNKKNASHFSSYSWSGQRKVPSYLHKNLFPQEFLSTLRTIAMQEHELEQVASLLGEHYDIWLFSLKKKSESRTILGCVASGLEGQLDLVRMENHLMQRSKALYGRMAELEEGTGTEASDSQLLEKFDSNDPDDSLSATVEGIEATKSRVNRRSCIVYRRGQKQLTRMFLREAERLLELSAEEQT
ncbi:Calcium-dependent protein kinase 3 [Triticum urartu]|uniref:Calcium-dependent protein kinase 3 n=1 Tax=Triticum urartu TaxID=4572 RepID=M7Y5K8_TRIUA|nr:Calcium-dependent protein kinase 3 [Triticum urartu]